MSYTPQVDKLLKQVKALETRLQILENVNQQLLGLIVNGTLTVTGLTSANGGLSIPLHNGSTDVVAAGNQNGLTLWIGTSDPGGSAAEGDVWIKG